MTDEEIAAAWSKAKGGGSGVKPRAGLPGVYMARGVRGIVVSRGRVIDGTGTAPLGTYLDELDFLGKRQIDVDGLLFLLFAFHALPQVEPVATEEGYFNSFGAGKPLDPRLDFDDGTARVILSYLLPMPSREGGAPDGPEPRPVWEWTLTIQAGRPPTWSDRRYDWVP